ncbi:MAG TPA: helix-turn-helix domain-containing protein [Acidimicrobiales bacterium]|nr:helix-turn-helix domain-containing protein [Acidimicrobiales bacterium]
MAGEVSEDEVGAWRALLLTQNAVLRAIEADLQREGMVPLTWYDVLLELNAVEGRRLRMQELAARTVLSRTRVSRLVDEMAAAGLVRREPDPDDGRAAFAVLTPAGRRALRRAAPCYLAGIRRYFTDHLDEGEVGLVASALGKVVEAHDPQRSATKERRGGRRP